MIVQTTQKLPGGIYLTIVEAQDQLIQDHFDKRFQVVLFVDGKLRVPKHKKRYLVVRTSEDQHHLTTDSGTVVEVPVEAFLEKRMCDRSLEDCNTELLQYLSMYNEGKDVRSALKLKYSI